MGVVFGWREMREAQEIQIPREIEFPMKHAISYGVNQTILSNFQEINKGKNFP